MEIIKKITDNFIDLTRVYSLPATIASFFPIYVYSKYSENFIFLNLFLLFIGVVCVHLGTNMFDDYIDTKIELKKTGSLSKIYFKSFEQKARLLRDEVFSFREFEIIISIFYIIALFIGCYFIIFSSPFIVLYMFFGAILSLFYPISAKYYLSETILALIWGPLIINGGYLALTKTFNPQLCFFSFVIGVALVIFAQCHYIMDWEFDLEAGKKTLPILSKTKENAIKNLKYLIIISYLLIVLGVALGQFNPKMFAVFLTLPIATKLLSSLNDYINIKDVKFERRWYWGFFENFNQFENQKIDFYMYRVLLGRNYLFFFSLFASIGAIL